MTVARTALVDYWPLVDIAKLELQPGDAVLLRPMVTLRTDQQQHLHEVWRRHFPGVALVMHDATIELFVERASREMVEGDLYEFERVDEVWRRKSYQQL